MEIFFIVLKIITNRKGKRKQEKTGESEKEKEMKNEKEVLQIFAILKQILKLLVKIYIWMLKSSCHDQEAFLQILCLVLFCEVAQAVNFSASSQRSIDLKITKKNYKN